jgi:hypothetical protein
VSVFGHNTIGGATDDAVWPGFKYGSSFAFSDDSSEFFRVTAFKAYIDGSFGSVDAYQRLRGALHADNGSGNPGALLGRSLVYVNSQGQAPGWVTILPLGDVVFPGGTGLTYHLSLLGGTTSDELPLTTFYYDWQAGAAFFNHDGVDATSDPSGAVTRDNALFSIYVEYEPYTPPDPSVAITYPLGGAVLSGVETIQMDVEAAHHVQVEISQNAVNWDRLGAKNRSAPWELDFNSRFFPNGTYYLRARLYTGSRESTLALTTPTVEVSIDNPVGVTRIFRSADGDTLVSALAASDDYDAIVFEGDFGPEGQQVHIDKIVTISGVTSSAGDRTPVRTRLIEDVEGVIYRGLDFEVHPPDSGTGTTIGNTNERGIVFYDCGFTNGGSSGNVGMMDGLEYLFGRMAKGTRFDTCDFHDNGDWSSSSESSIFHVHGLYAQNALHLYVVDSAFWKHAARFVQLYPNCQQPTVYRCVGRSARNALNFGGDVGMANDTTLAAPLAVGDTTATITDPSHWPDGDLLPDTCFLRVGSESIPILSRSGSVLTLGDGHYAYPAGTTAKLYTRTCYGSVERCIFDHTGHTGDGTRPASDGMIYAWWMEGAGPAGIGNEVLECWFHDPHTSGTAPQLPDPLAYLDTRTGGFIDAGGNVFGIEPGFTDPEAYNFKLTSSSPAVGYGPRWIQPDPVEGWIEPAPLPPGVAPGPLPPSDPIVVAQPFR